MAQTYCGKSCEACPHKAELKCAGCEALQSAAPDKSCEIARCCVRKGYATCGSCAYGESCAMLQTRDRQPEYRKAQMPHCSPEVAEHTNVLATWLWVLFWLVVPSILSGLMANETLGVDGPIYRVGQVLGIVCNAVYGLILCKISVAERHYRTAGICRLLTVVGSSAVVFLADTSDLLAVLIIALLLFVVVSLLGEYQEFVGHSNVLVGLDDPLSYKWRALWKWYIGTLIGIFVSIVILVLIPIVGALVLIATLIGLIVVSVLKLVYLYRTAKRFREYQADLMR